MAAPKKTTRKAKTSEKKTVARNTTKRETAEVQKSEKITPVTESERRGIFSSVGLTGPSKLRLSKKTLYFLAGLVLLLCLGYLANRYMVVAWVDNQPISKIEYYKQLDQKYGSDLREQLIIQKLLEDESRKQGVKVSDEEINNEIKKIQQEQGGEQQLNQILQMQNIGQDEFKNLVKLQLLRQKLFSKDIQVSDDEVSKYIEDNKTQFQNQTVDDKLKQQIKDQLLQQKVTAKFNEWLKNTLQSSRVKRS